MEGIDADWTTISRSEYFQAGRWAKELLRIGEVLTSMLAVIDIDGIRELAVQ